MTIPRTRADCLGGPRPCPHYTCRYHLWVECRGEELPDESCALDIVDQYPGGLSSPAIGVLLGVSRQRIDQIEQGALIRVRKLAVLRR